MSSSECRSELVQRERRGKLSDSERLALEAHVDTCDSCRMTRVLGADFDHWNVVDTEDAERLERMQRKAKHWVDKPRRLTQPRHMRWALAAVGTTLAAAAAAATVTVSRLRWLQPPQAEGTTASSAVALPPSTSLRPAPQADQRPSLDHPLEDPIVTEIPGTATAAGGTPNRVTSPGAGTQISAEQLLQKANLARRNGDTGEAVRLFRRLQRDYPNSREAALSLVALGTLLLESGQAELALDEFNLYLGLGAGAALAAEALYGKGRALALLGRTEQEQKVWRRLLVEFPKSPYTSHANRRLGIAK